MNIRNTLLAVATVTSLVAIQTSSANACGLIGCLVDRVVPGAGRVLDGAHDAMGRPLDRAANVAAGAGANIIVPGSGPYVTGALEARDRFNRMNNGAPVGAPMPGPVGYPGAAPVTMPMMGNRCLLPNGAALFGPVNPVGSPCAAMTPYGQMFGQVIQ